MGSGMSQNSIQVQANKFELQTHLFSETCNQARFRSVSACDLAPYLEDARAPHTAAGAVSVRAATGQPIRAASLTKWPRCSPS